MGKMVFTIALLILALFIADKVKTFVEHNRPKVKHVEENIDTDNVYDIMNASTTPESF